jgi:hypothetical protein
LFRQTFEQRNGSIILSLKKEHQHSGRAIRLTLGAALIDDSSPVQVSKQSTHVRRNCKGPTNARVLLPEPTANFCQQCSSLKWVLQFMPLPDSHKRRCEVVSPDSHVSKLL